MIQFISYQILILSALFQCQISVLPLGTGNDLARVLGWGSTCYDVAVVPLVLKQLERARPEMLDRYAMYIYFLALLPLGE